MRMHIRRLTRPKNAFAKKVENHACAFALHMMITTSSMAAGVTDKFWEIGDMQNWSKMRKSRRQSVGLTKRLAPNLLLLGCLVFCSSPGHAEASVREFFELYDKASPDTKFTERAHVAGILIGIGWTEANLKDRADICQPDKFVLEPVQMIDWLRHQALEDASLARQPYGLAILQTLKRIFPCVKNSN